MTKPAPVRVKLKTVKRDDGWWITGAPFEEPDCGPYNTKAEAEDDRPGLEFFWEHRNEVGWMTSERPS